MKKLQKLSISKDKIIENEELVNLKGGEYKPPCGTYVTCLNYLNELLYDLCMAPFEDIETAKEACGNGTMYVRTYENDYRCCPY